MTSKPVLDQHTKEVIFREIRNVQWDRLIALLSPFSSALIDTRSLDEFQRNPLSDLAQIRERLDTIEEIVNDEELRKRISAVIPAFGKDYGELFKEKYERFLFDKRLNLKHSDADNLGYAIKEIATEGKNLQASFRKLLFSTRTLADIASDYETIVNAGGIHSIFSFYQYMIELHKKIEEVMGPKREEYKKMQEENKDCQSPSISLEEMDALLDHDFISKLNLDFSPLSQVLTRLYPYIMIASLAVEKGWTRPDVVGKEENCLVIRNGYLSKYKKEEAVPNSIHLNPEIRVEIKEGPNEAGKTFSILTEMEIATLALCGSYVPAEFAKVSIRDHIILREKGTGRSISAFQFDCRNANETSPPEGEYWLIGLDESFTSTEQKGGRALWYGKIKEIEEQEKSLLLGSSHYLGLDEEFKDDPKVKFVHFPFVRVVKDKTKITVDFPHKKEDGPQLEKDYAIAVARSVGFDETILRYAEERLQEREREKTSKKYSLL